MGCGASSGPPPHTDAYTDAYKRQLTADLMMARKARDKNAAEMVLDAFGIYDAFMVLDKDGNGYVTAAELRAIMPTNVPAAEVDAMLREADLEDHDGRLNYEEFVRFVDPAGYGAQGRHFEGKVRRAGELMIAHLKIDPDSEVSILEAFKPLDSDHNGFVSYADLRHVLTNLDEKLTDEEVGDVLRAVDAAGGAAANGGRFGEVARGDGQICYEDFVSFVKAIGKRSSAVWDIPTGTVVERKRGSRKERAATSSGKVAPDSRPTNGSIAKLALSSPSGKGSGKGETWSQMKSVIKAVGKQASTDAKLEYEWGSSKLLQTLDLDKMTKNDLQSHLDARGLSVRISTKSAMRECLQADLEGERLQATGTVVEAAGAPPPLHDIVDALKRNLGLDGTWPEVVDAGCLQLGVPPTGSLQEKGDACWRAMEG